MRRDAPSTATTRNGKAKPSRGRRLRGAMTPMIDVTFLLLLFFMLSFTFRDFEGQIKAQLPGRDPTGPIIVMPIAVRVRSEGVTGARYEIEGVNETIHSPARLGEMLDAIRQRTRADSPVRIRPDAFVRWGHVVEAVNQAVRMKFSTVQIDPLS